MLQSVTFGTARRSLGGATAHQTPFLAAPNVTAQPSTASVPITVLLYNGPLLCGFNVLIKGLNMWSTCPPFYCTNNRTFTRSDRKSRAAEMNKSAITDHVAKENHVIN